MPHLYSTAESVEALAQQAIPMFHPHLATARISYLFVDKASMKNGQPVLGKVRRISGVMEFMVEKDFMIEIPLDQWNELGETQRHALVDHLLERCNGEEDEKSGEMKWGTREHDVQEFSTILRRHGAWTTTLAGFVSVAKTINVDEMVAETLETENVTTV